MSDDWKIRRAKAEEISEKINDLAEGVMIVGSVAYNPLGTTSESDLDLVVILDFLKVNFKELYEKLDQPYNDVLVKHAQEGNISNVSVVWDSEKFEVGLHLWDITAFERVISLEKYNLTFRGDDFKRPFNSTADSETLKNLSGKSKEFYKNPKKVDGGSVLQFYIYCEDSSGFYTGVQCNNLLLDPAILYENNNLISKGVENFKRNLRKKLKDLYGSSSDEINLYNALAPKLQEKISEDLKKRLKEFF